MGIYRNTRTVTTDVILTSTDENVLVDVTSGAVEIMLPPASGDSRVNDVIKITHYSGDVTTNNITIIAHTADTATILGGTIVINSTDGVAFVEYADNDVWVNITNNSSTEFTGNTSGSCIADLWVTNIYGCSPITAHDTIQSITSTGSSTTQTIAFGLNTLASGDYSQAFGQGTIASGGAAHSIGGIEFSSGSTSCSSTTETSAVFAVPSYVLVASPTIVDGGFGDAEVYDLYLTLTGDATTLHTIYGSLANPLTASTAYNHSTLSVDVGGTNPAFWGVFSDSQWDSWLTVGVTGATGGVTNIGFDFTNWSSTALSATTVSTGGAIVVDPTTNYSGTVVVGRITVPLGSTFSVKLNAQGKSSDSTGDDWYQEDLHFTNGTADTPQSPLPSGFVCKNPNTDINGDSVVDGADLTILIGDFDTTTAQSDFNNDGIVDYEDVQLLQRARGFDPTSWGTGSTHSFITTTTNPTIASGVSSHAGGAGTLVSGDYSFGHSYNSFVTGARSAVLGGNGITGVSDDTVYVPNLNIDTTPSSATGTDVLVRESNGDIRVTPLSGLTGGTGVLGPWSAGTGINSAVLGGSAGTASSPNSISEGTQTVASGNSSHAEGVLTNAGGTAAHAEGLATQASGDYSHAEGSGTLASGDASHAEGSNTTANGFSSHSEGFGSVASGSSAHAEGSQTNAGGTASHAEGQSTEASGNYSHAEGFETLASGLASHAEGLSVSATTTSSHAEGNQTISSGFASHAEGNETTASGDNSHAEGNETVASGDQSHAEGNQTVASGPSAHAEGLNTLASGDYSHAEGLDTIANNNTSHAEGFQTLASGVASHAEGNQTTASGSSAHAEGFQTTASGDYSHAEGFQTLASGDYSHAEGLGNLASGIASHAEGGYDDKVLKPTSATTFNAHAEGYGTLASGENSHAEGSQSIASGPSSHAEGGSTTASGAAAHSEGLQTVASGNYSHAEGRQTLASGISSHAEGERTVASGNYSHAGGIGFNGTYKLIASGDTSFVHQRVLNNPINVFMGAFGDYSAILGGTDNHIESGATRSVVLGGNGITADTAETVYVPNLNISNTPSSATGSDVLVRESNGDIRVTPLSGITSGPTKYSITTGFTGSVAQTIVHNLGTDEIIAQVWNSANTQVTPTIQLTSGDETDAVDITVATTGNYKIVIIG